MLLIRGLLKLAVLLAAGLLVYNYVNGKGWTLQLPSSTEPQVEQAQEKSGEFADRATDAAKKAAGELRDAVDQGALTTKIKAKMALDDTVKARDIDVDTAGTVVTLRGTVASNDERERAVRLAKETAGVTEVVDKLEVKRP
jgi:hyperosmotically inducible periplasmic protein